MKTNATGLAVLLLLAVAWTSASAQRRGIITCSCPIGNGISQQGKLVGNLCYIVGVGSCRSFNYEGSSQSQPQQQQQYQPQQYQQPQQQEPTDQYTQQQEYQNQYKNLYQQQYQQRQQQQQPQQDQYQPQDQYSQYQQQDQYSSQSQANQRSYPYQSQSRFQNRYDSNRPSHSRFSSPSSHQPQQQHRNFNSRHFGAPAPTDTAITPSRRFESSRPGRFDLAAAAATASPEQARAAAEDARRQLDSRRSFESHLAESGVTVRPGSAEAAQAAERRPDEKSAELGNKALAQILFLQSLLGRNGRR